MTPAPYVPVETGCPECGTQAWGLRGHLSGPPDAVCWPDGHARPVRRIEAAS